MIIGEKKKKKEGMTSTLCSFHASWTLPSSDVGLDLCVLGVESRYLQPGHGGLLRPSIFSRTFIHAPHFPGGVGGVWG